MKYTESSYSIYIQRSFGPAFGNYKESDLSISDNSNSNTFSYSDLGNSYKHPEHVKGSTEAKTFLPGSYNFQVSQIEVFTKI